MKKILIASALILGISQLANAQPRPPQDMNKPSHAIKSNNQNFNDHRRVQPQTHNPTKHSNRRAIPNNKHINHAPPPDFHHYKTATHHHTMHGDLRSGHRLPDYYRHNQYVVTDWKRHNLYAPPKGYHWVQAGSNYVLVAVATGIITSILLGY